MSPSLVRTMTGFFESNTSRAILPKVALASAIVSAFTSEIQTVVVTGASRPLRVHQSQHSFYFVTYCLSIIWWTRSGSNFS